ncbi:hypothetical protein CC85DRAFT_282922 [Cutaneotrichosporon oleaginosum]|uniref:Hydantoin racemase n=1 Tax=Cutaneotrichosporon oleaginosum TaxID=879819 RepID=A0A0J1BAS1_9TREE|nr:uncharacterized protein CC85DRAFT_282922 [Cutaneotrichosporon oleaginosum]KLT45014.1 hypothetical protein CC85DRAFT_282922 [Cutaneotrichosporon oleaginosum]
MPFILSPDPARRPRVLIINPNATEAFTEGIRGTLRADVELDFYTAPAAHAPASIESATDEIVSAAACLSELRAHVDKWDGFVVACFSAHPLVPALRELSAAPAVGILEASLLMGSTLGGRVGILTTSPRWEPLLEGEIAALGLAGKNAAGVVSSGLAVLDLEELPRASVIKVLCTAAADVLQDRRGADVIVLGCAGMAGLEDAVGEACQPGLVVLDPVRCGLEMCLGLIRMGARTSKVGLYAPA